MIISLTCLLIRDPIVYSDSEMYNDYKELRKQAEENLYKVNKNKNNFMAITSIFMGRFLILYREIKKLLL